MSRILLCLLTLQIAAAAALADDDKQQSKEEKSSRSYAARVADYRTQDSNTEEVSPMPAVFDNEVEFRASYHGGVHLPAMPGYHGYTPGCCDDGVHYTHNLWAGYCEHRKRTWYSKWLRLGLGSSCGCGDCK